jgi:hypothetical protein
VTVRNGPSRPLEFSPNWTDSNFAQVTISKGDLDDFEWALLILRTRTALNEFKGTRTQMFEVDGQGGKEWQTTEKTRVFMLSYPLLTEGSIKRVRAALDKLGTDKLVFGTEVRNG